MSKRDRRAIAAAAVAVAAVVAVALQVWAAYARAPADIARRPLHTPPLPDDAALLALASPSFFVRSVPPPAPDAEIAWFAAVLAAARPADTPSSSLLIASANAEVASGP
ncbi:hypothetical protein HDU84_008523, partial [Entophlyctis sp. JEL0112]